MLFLQLCLVQMLFSGISARADSFERLCLDNHWAPRRLRRNIDPVDRYRAEHTPYSHYVPTGSLGGVLAVPDADHERMLSSLGDAIRQGERVFLYESLTPHFPMYFDVDFCVWEEFSQALTSREAVLRWRTILAAAIKCFFDCSVVRMLYDSRSDDPEERRLRDTQERLNHRALFGLLAVQPGTPEADADLDASVACEPCDRSERIRKFFGCSILAAPTQVRTDKASGRRYVKCGMHFIFANVIVDYQRAIRVWTAAVALAKKYLGYTLCMMKDTNWEKVIDVGVYKNGLRLPYSFKAIKCVDCGCSGLAPRFVTRDAKRKNPIFSMSVAKHPVVGGTMLLPGKPTPAAQHFAAFTSYDEGEHSMTVWEAIERGVPHPFYDTSEPMLPPPLPKDLSMNHDSRCVYNNPTLNHNFATDDDGIPDNEQDAHNAGDMGETGETETTATAVESRPIEGDGHGDTENDNNNDQLLSNDELPLNLVPVEPLVESDRCAHCGGEGYVYDKRAYSPWAYVDGVGNQDKAALDLMCSSPALTLRLSSVRRPASTPLSKGFCIYNYSIPTPPDKMLEFTPRFSMAAMESGGTAVRDRAKAWRMRMPSEAIPVPVGCERFREVERYLRNAFSRTYERYSDVRVETLFARDASVSTYVARVVGANSRYCYNKGGEHATAQVYFVFTHQACYQRCGCRCMSATFLDYIALEREASKPGSDGSMLPSDFDPADPAKALRLRPELLQALRDKLRNTASEDGKSVFNAFPCQLYRSVPVPLPASLKYMLFGYAESSVREAAVTSARRSLDARIQDTETPPNIVHMLQSMRLAFEAMIKNRNKPYQRTPYWKCFLPPGAIDPFAGISLGQDDNTLPFNPDREDSRGSDGANDVLFSLTGADNDDIDEDAESEHDDKDENEWDSEEEFENKTRIALLEQQLLPPIEDVPGGDDAVSSTNTSEGSKNTTNKGKRKSAFDLGVAGAEEISNDFVPANSESSFESSPRSHPPPRTTLLATPPPTLPPAPTLATQQSKKRTNRTSIGGYRNDKNELGDGASSNISCQTAKKKRRVHASNINRGAKAARQELRSAKHWLINDDSREAEDISRSSSPSRLCLCAAFALPFFFTQMIY